MKKYVVINKDKLTKKDELNNKAVLLWFNEDTQLKSNQYVLRVSEDIESQFREYVKYTEQEIIAARDSELMLIEKHAENVSNKRSPFASKYLEDGSKLYENVHGCNDSFAADETKTLRIKVPYSRCFFTEAEIINASAGSVCQFTFEIELSEGVYYNVYQHGHDVNICEGYYHRKSDYEAELNASLWIAATITNGDTDKKIGLNIILHEVK